MSNAGTPFSLDTVWSSLLDGDPGPALSFADALVDNDMAFAAGGFLNDLAERMHDADESIEDDQQRSAFVAAIEQVLRHALDNDPSALDELLEK